MDNRYYNYGCPAIWSNSRDFTNYYDSRIFEQYIRKINNIDSAQEYRHFLQNNAETIMNSETDYFIRNNTCDVNGQCVPLQKENVLLQKVNVLLQKENVPLQKENVPLQKVNVPLQKVNVPLQEVAKEEFVNINLNKYKFW